MSNPIGRETSLLRESIPVTEIIGRLGGSVDPGEWGEFDRLYSLLALRFNADGCFYKPNWWRGPLLYNLVLHHQPSTLLEFGTGRGYGSVSMAKALVDAGIPGTVYTIDIVPPDQPQRWAIDEGAGPIVKHLSLDEVWAKHLSAEVRQRIHCLTGDSDATMKHWKRQGLPKVDFCFIDAGHSYWDVKCDFLAALRTANPYCLFLFDDYTTRKGFGVDRLLNQEVLPRLDAGRFCIIDTFSQDQVSVSEQVEHLMALLTPGASNSLEKLSAKLDSITFRWSYELYRRMRKLYAKLRR